MLAMWGAHVDWQVGGRYGWIAQEVPQPPRRFFNLRPRGPWGEGWTSRASTGSTGAVNLWPPVEEPDTMCRGVTCRLACACMHCVLLCRCGRVRAVLRGRVLPQEVPHPHGDGQRHLCAGRPTGGEACVLAFKMSLCCGCVVGSRLCKPETVTRNQGQKQGDRVRQAGVGVRIGCGASCPCVLACAGVGGLYQLRQLHAVRPGGCALLQALAADGLVAPSPFW